MMEDACEVDESKGDKSVIHWTVEHSMLNFSEAMHRALSIINRAFCFSTMDLMPCCLLCRRYVQITYSSLVADNAGR